MHRHVRVQCLEIAVGNNTLREVIQTPLNTRIGGGWQHEAADERSDFVVAGKSVRFRCPVTSWLLCFHKPTHMGHPVIGA